MARLLDDGSTQYLEIDSAVVSDEAFTMACLFNTDDDTANQALMCIGDKDVANHQHALMANGDIGGDVVSAQTRAGGAFTRASTSSGFTAGTWHHACGLFIADASRKAYIDGANEGTNVTDLTVANIDRTSIGRLGDSGSPSGYMYGKIAQAVFCYVEF